MQFIKRQFFTFIFVVFQSQSIAEILLFPHLVNKRTPYGNSTSGFNFELFIVIGMWFCAELTNFIRIERSLTELWRNVDFPRWRPYGGHTVVNLLSLSGFITLAFRQAKNYLHTKFRPDISIHGRDITTSGFCKQMAAILKLYFRFRFWPFLCHRHVVFHRRTKFH